MSGFIGQNPLPNLLPQLILENDPLPAEVQAEIDLALGALDNLLLEEEINDPFAENPPNAQGAQAPEDEANHQAIAPQAPVREEEAVDAQPMAAPPRRFWHV